LSDTALLRHKIFWGAFIFSSGNLLQAAGLLYYQKVTTFFWQAACLNTGLHLTATKSKKFKRRLMREYVDIGSAEDFIIVGYGAVCIGT
jgi:hypothetical protein